MLDFVKLVFGGFFNVILWVILIGCAIAGGIIGAFWGVIIGIIVGLWVNVVFGGFVATIINIGENLELLKVKLRKIGNAPTAIQPERKCNKCGKTSQGYSSCPHCGDGTFE